MGDKVRLAAFRVENFRSIRDTGWCDLSSDNINGLIGQNESGKSSILEALESFYDKTLLVDYLRDDITFPRVSCSFEVTGEEIVEIFVNFQVPEKLLKLIEKNNNRLNLTRTWTNIDANSSTLDFEQNWMNTFWETIKGSGEEQIIPTPDTVETTSQVEQTQDVDVDSLLEKDELLSGLLMNMPTFELFEDNGSLLPATIDLADIIKNNPKTEGIKGAQNFLSIVGINPENISGTSERMIERRIRDANRKLTKEFQDFWSQYIGKNNKIEIEFNLKRHDASDPATAGQAYLVFWVKDGEEILHPAQRSKGVQWFLSFFLQLKASALHAEKGQVLLIDEPGASLHAKAQKDVLKVFEDIKENLQIIYTTHSPYLIEADTLYRLLAVQRSDEEDNNSETKVFGVHHLSGASEDTLLPIYTLIGVSLQHQRVIKAKNNIILEEPSAYYYFKGLKHLLGESKEMNFIPSSGVTKIPLLVNLFIGWGLDFIVLTDDDEAGKKTRRKLKAEVYGGVKSESEKHLFAIKDCKGIEDIFTKGDFKKHILGNKSLSYTDDNSEYSNKNKESKLMNAVKFSQAVEKEVIKAGDLSTSTMAKAKAVFEQIKSNI